MREGGLICDQTIELTGTTSHIYSRFNRTLLF